MGSETGMVLSIEYNGLNTCVLLKKFCKFVNTSFLVKGGTNNKNLYINVSVCPRVVGKSLFQ